ncbi:MAG: SDR family oxidoreductase [Bryobacterales bacterium]|nr:SDR family oxidoreductase [Bryobacterales bacterium]
MTQSLEGKVALVTGASKGIGLAIAHRLLTDGASVAICGRNQAALAAAESQLVRDFPAARVLAVQADVSKLAEVRRLVSSVQDRFSRLDVLVNNAGVGVFRSVGDLSPEEWHAMLDTNLSGVYYCCHEALPLLKGAGSSFIINIGSLAGRNAFAGGAGYNASKFGLLGFSEALMLDHRYDGVRVSCVMPGSVDTEFGHSGTGKPWKIQPEDIADTVAHLLAMPERTLISRVEVRPSMPAK